MFPWTVGASAKKSKEQVVTVIAAVVLLVSLQWNPDAPPP